MNKLRVVHRFQKSGRQRLLSEIPPELQRGAPRQVVLTGAGRAVWICIGMLLTLALGAAVGFDHLAERDAALLRQYASGTNADAQITSLRKVENNRWRLHYQYEANGRSFEGKQTLHRGDHRPLEVGKTVAIRYLAESPQRNWVRGYGPGAVPYVLTILIPIGLVLLAIVVWLSLRRQRGLLVDGRAVVAHITSSRLVRAGKENHHRLEYEFTILSGATRRGRYSIDAHHTPPIVGTALVVVYSPDTPERSARYPFSTYRAV